MKKRDSSGRHSTHRGQYDNECRIYISNVWQKMTSDDKSVTCLHRIPLPLIKMQINSKAYLVEYFYLITKKQMNQKRGIL